MRRAQIDQQLLSDPAIRAALANRPSLCYAESGSMRIASPTDDHIKNVLRESYSTGTPIEPWCLWCGHRLSATGARLD